VFHWIQLCYFSSAWLICPKDKTVDLRKNEYFRTLIELASHGEYNEYTSLLIYPFIKVADLRLNQNCYWRWMTWRPRIDLNRVYKKTRQQQSLPADISWRKVIHLTFEWSQNVKHCKKCDAIIANCIPYLNFLVYTMSLKFILLFRYLPFRCCS